MDYMSFSQGEAEEGIDARFLVMFVGTIRTVKSQVMVKYVPGHSGVLFNEQADKLAGETERFSELIRTPTDVIAELDVRTQEEENVVQGKTFLYSAD